MNLNQSRTEQHRRRCIKDFYNVVSLLDKLFISELGWVDERTPFKVTYGNKITWRAQIDTHKLEYYTIKYCEPEYYGLLNKRVKDYKLKKRLVQNRTNLFIPEDF